MSIFKVQSTEERRNQILNGNILYTLLFLSIPTLMLGTIQALIPLSDGLFLTNLTSTVIAGAVSFSQPILNIMLALSQGLGVAALSIIGQEFGRGDIKLVKEYSLQTFIFSFIIGIFLIPICIISAFWITEFISPEIRHYVFIYISLHSIVMPFIFLASIFNAIKNAIGRPEVTFFRIVILLFLKIIFNTIFLYIFRMGIVGAVMATLFSYIIITIWMFHDIFIKKSDMKLNIYDYKPNLNAISQLIKIGLPSMINYMLIYVGFFLINKEVDKFGHIALAGQGIASNINSICFILPPSIGTTVTTMISMNMGIGNLEKSKKIFKYGWITSLIISIFTIIIIIPFSEFFSLLFTREEEVLTIANNALHIYTYSVVGFGIFSICQGVFIALGRTKIPMFMSILRIWFLRYLFVLVTKSFLGVYSVFWGHLFSNTVAGIIFFILVLKLDWKTYNFNNLKFNQ